MAMPKQVQAQIAEIEAYEKALEAQQNPHTEELDTETEVVAEVAASTKPEKAKPADTSPTDVEEETFKQKYKTLTGKYDAEVPRLHQQVREMTEQQDAVIQKLQDDLAKTGSQVGEVGFSQRLNIAVPDFPQIDNDERWVSWLNEHDPMLRGPRRDQAQQAFDAGDVEAIAHYVSLWKETLAAPADARPNQAELEKQVAPNRSANSVRTQSTAQNSKVYSPRDADRAWEKVRTLNTRGQYAEAEKLEADLTVAYMEGRVRT